MQKKCGVHIGTTPCIYLCAIEYQYIYEYAEYKRFTITSTNHRPMLKRWNTDDSYRNNRQG